MDVIIKEMLKNYLADSADFPSEMFRLFGHNLGADQTSAQSVVKPK